MHGFQKFDENCTTQMSTMVSKKIPLFLCILGLGLPSVLTAQRFADKPIVVLDPGHGGTDEGAISVEGGKEKDIVLQLSQVILALNHQVLQEPLQLYMTRYSDTLISLFDRGRLSRSLQADLFVSIHGNHAPNPRAQGLEVFIWKAFPRTRHPFKETSHGLAEKLTAQLQQQVGLKNRGIKKANFQVLRDNRDQCSAVLLELGFLSNDEEAAYLKSKRGINAMALAVLMGISNHLNHAGTN